MRLPKSRASPPPVVRAEQQARRILERARERDGADASVALAEARRALRAAADHSPSRAHPFFWAPFVLVGD